MIRQASRIFAALIFALPCARAFATLPPPARHVLLISVDGLHAVDLARYVADHPRSALGHLQAAGVSYTDARTPAPADSFPGLLALLTGGTPAVTGVYYDVTWDRRFAPPTGPCIARGARVAWNESIDRAGGGSIDPGKLPRDPARGCAPVRPWQYLRVNTVFDVVRQAGGGTAWADKHPAYDIIQGPHGDGVEDLYTPEIGANGEDLASAAGRGITGSIVRTEAYDAHKMEAVLHEIAGLRHDGRTPAPVPAVFGLNIQEVNVAQKVAGYLSADGAPSAPLENALHHVDALLHEARAALAAHGLAASTLIILTAKHGNGPIDPSRVRHIPAIALREAIERAAPGELAQLTADQGALVWLHRASAAARIAHSLDAERAPLGIQRVLWGARLALRFPAPAGDSRAPDLIVIPEDGVIYAKPGAVKRAEHGGFLADDRHVALLLSGPMLAAPGRRLHAPVMTTQVAPTILRALGLDPARLDAVREQGTPVLRGLVWHETQSE
ncbi:MAG TPA: alkaline phosphatase family protein [Steroidobacteraceae bacterium]|nr:alkaline phosphatase family protein [Steroidobacteraceae bacterium]